MLEFQVYYVFRKNTSGDICHFIRKLLVCSIKGICDIRYPLYKLQYNMGTIRFVHCSIDADAVSLSDYAVYNTGSLMPACSWWRIC